MNLSLGKDICPMAEELVIHADLHSFVPGVDTPCVPIYGDVFKAVQRLVLQQLVVEDLCVVRHRPGGGVPQQHQQFDGTVHAMHTAGGDGGDEVSWCLLHGHLVGQRGRHVAPVPLQPQPVALIIIEEVHLLLCCNNIRVKVEELQKGPCATLAHPDDDAGRQTPLQASSRGAGGCPHPPLLLQQFPEA